MYDLVIPEGSFTATSGTTSIHQHFTISAGTFAHNSGTIALIQRIKTVDIGTATLNDVVIDNGTNRIDITGTINMDGNLNIVSAGRFNYGTIAVAGNVVTTDTTVAGDAIILFNGTGNQTIDATGDGEFPDGVVTIDKSTGTATLISNLTPDGSSHDLAITQGTLDLNGYNLIVNDDLSVGGSGILRLEGGETVTTTSSTINTGSEVIYDGGGIYTGLAAGSSYHHLSFTGNWTLGASLDCNGNFTLTSGTVDADFRAIYVAGNW